MIVKEHVACEGAVGSREEEMKGGREGGRGVLA